MEYVTIKATRSQIEDFKESIIWADIVAELNSWKQGFEGEMKAIVEDAAVNNPSTAQVLLHMGDLNGRLKAVDYMMGILDVFLSILPEKSSDEPEANGG